MTTMIRPHHDRAPRRLAIGSHLFLGVLTVLALSPVFWGLLSAFKEPASIIIDPLGFDASRLTLQNFEAMFRDVPIGNGFLNTGIMLVFKGGLTLALCPLAGYAFAKFEFPFKRLIFGAVLVTLMLPVVVLIIPWLLEMKQFGWVNSYQALILPGAVDAFAIFWMRQVIASVPDELLDSARIDGASELGIYTRIVVPVIRPGLAGLAVVTTMYIYNDFVWPVVIATGERMQTLQVVLASLAHRITGANIGADFATVWGELLAASAFATIPLLIIFILLQRHFINGILAGSVKG